MSAALRASAAHVFVPSLDVPELADDDARHLLRVLRLRDGAEVSASDGRGSWRICRLRGAQLEPAGAVQFIEPRSPVQIAAAIPKGDRLEWMVQKLTEMGVDDLCLIDCARSVVRWDTERGAKNLARLHRVSREAAMQSRRVRLLTIDGPLPFGEVARRAGAQLADPGGSDDMTSGWLLVGPEGGFTDEELAAAPTVNLARQVLRVETAALVAAVLLGRLAGER